MKKFDIIIGRAVAPLPKFLVFCRNIRKDKTIYILPKGANFQSELLQLKKQWYYDVNIVKNNKEIDKSGGVTIVLSNLKKKKMKRTVFSIVNQKGGVGKTTTAVNLATALSISGKSCLVVDLDPQGNASTGFAINSNRRKPGTYEVLTQKVGMIDAIKPTEVNGLGIVPSRVDLANAETEIPSTVEEKEYILKNAIDKLPQQYSAIIVDCPPGLGFLTINALAASDKVLIPLQCEFYALEGLSQILRVIKQVNTELNAGLDLDGILLTMHDARNKLSIQVEEDVREVMGKAVYKTIIPRNIKISESPSHGKPVLLYDHSCIGSEAYVSLAAEVLGKGNFGGLSEN